MNAPRWFEPLLLLLLKPEHRESVSGDLLEEYRETVMPARGSMAPAWYLSQLAGFLWRASWIWAVMFAGLTVARFLLDTFVPPTDFGMRSSLTTWSHVTVALLGGFWTTWRTERVLSAGLVMFTAGVMAGAISIVSTLAVVLIWHDVATMTAIERSGGLSEALTLPLIAPPIIAICGMIGGLMGKTAAKVGHTRLSRSSS